MTEIKFDNCTIGTVKIDVHVEVRSMGASCKVTACTIDGLSIDGDMCVLTGEKKR